MQVMILLGLLGFISLVYRISVWVQTIPVATTVDLNEPILHPQSHTNPGNAIAHANATGPKWVRSGNGMTSRDPCF